MKRSFSLFIIVSLFICSCTTREEKQFSKISGSVSGIRFKNKLKESPELNILNYLYYYNGGGVAAADFNNDKLVDLYFTSNQGEDKLYINQGNLTFKDVTQIANINNTGNWTTGVTHVDINNDGFLDIYVCKVGNYQNIKGRNYLYVNQGLGTDGIPSFKEEAKRYGLAFSGLSTQAAFFDYDLDGDLDMYLMNHSTHPNRNNGRGSQRQQIDTISGDRLYTNTLGKFKDTSKEAGIFQGKIGYGLGLGISDLNNDGYPDIYIGNDFFENDYLYMNQKDGTFKEVISSDEKKLGHTSHFSMGNDMADINNDGYTDIISMDMLPENLDTYKTSGLEYAFPIYQYYLKNGYSPQYMQNTLHLNLGNGSFSEIGNLSGISATEWSWGPLLADFDNDGHKDLFISNGIKGATNDMDFINFIANDNIQKRINKGMNNENMVFINELPKKKVPNYFFRNNGDLSFTNVTNSWLNKEDSFSNGCTYADLDNDGDLDIIVNNVDEEAYLLENTLNRKKEKHYLKIAFKGTPKNRFGIGSKVTAYTKSFTISQEHYTTKGYLSAVPETLHMGIGKDSIIDSLKILWPNGKTQTLKQVKANQRIVLNIVNAASTVKQKSRKPLYYLSIDSIIDFVHKEGNTIEFDRDPLVPFTNTNEGPTIAVGDINTDGLDDLFIGGAKGQSSVLLVQDVYGKFINVQERLFKEDAINEDTSSIFFDANGDGKPELLVVSGGNEFKNGKPLRPRFYQNENGVLKKDLNQFKTIEVNASKVVNTDLDNDGDQDIILVSDQIPQQFGSVPKQYIFLNDGKGNFTDFTRKIAKGFKDVGGVKDLALADIDNNGFTDIILVGHWFPIRIFLNDGKTLRRKTNSLLDNTHGWWNSITTSDFDNDGDIDFVAGNWGKNSKFRASKEKPITLYSNDFDSNGSVEPLVTYYHGRKETPFASKDELVKQMPFLNKKFLSYKSFSKASISELFSTKKLKEAQQQQIYELESWYYENDGTGNFKPKKLPAIAQTSTIHDIAVEDFNNDGFKDILLVGNSYEISTQLGRMDALHGLILLYDKSGSFLWNNQQNIDISGPARQIEKIKIRDEEHFIIAINNGKPIVLKTTRALAH